MIDHLMERTRGIKNFETSGKPSRLKEIAEVEEEKRLLVTADNSNPEFLRLDINKELFKQAGVNKTLAMIRLATGNFFSKAKHETVRKSAKACAFFVDGRGFYTGGRYSLFMFADLLTSYMDVIWVSDMEAPFLGDFPGTKVQMNIDGEIFNRPDAYDLKVDFIFGAPNVSGQAGLAYAQAKNIPCYLYLFEPPNFIQEYRKDGLDAQDEYWADYKKCLYQCDGIIVNSDLTAEKTNQWLGKEYPQISVLYPTWNDQIVQKVLKEEIKEKYDIVFCSRAAPFKSPLPVLRELRSKGFEGKVVIIGMVWTNDLKAIEGEGWPFEIILKGMLSDVEKFRTIAASKLMVYPSKFEGFGMPPTEALLFDKNCICYDLEVLQQNYSNAIEYVPLDSTSAMANMIIDYLKSGVSSQNKKKIEDVLAKYSPKATIERMREILPGGRLTLTVGIMIYDMAEWAYKVIMNAFEYADQIIVVHGRVRDYPEALDGDIGTMGEILRAKEDGAEFLLIDKKEASPYPSKVELQNEIAARVRGDIYLKQDGDEFWKSEDVRRIVKAFEDNPELDVAKVNFLHFWKGFDLIAKDAGGKWTAKHPRFWRWRKGFHHTNSHNFFVDGNEYMVDEPEYKVKTIGQKIFCYHCGYVRGVEGVQRKLAYYKNRGIENVVTDTYTNWEKGDPTQPTQSVRSWAEEWSGELPEILREKEKK